MKVYLPHLREKFNALQAAGRTQPRRADIARRLDVQDQTLLGWLHDGNQVPDKRLRALVQILISEAQAELSEVEARALWLGSIDNFRAALVFVPPVELNNVLRNCSDRLEVAFHPVSDGFGINEEALDLGDAPIDVQDGTSFQLLAHCNFARRLLILSQFATGLRVLAPGALHPGSVTKVPILFPDGGATLKFRAKYGPSRYIVIEHEADFIPNLVCAGDMDKLTDDVISQFARRLEAAKGNWRWGEAWLVEAK